MLVSMSWALIGTGLIFNVQPLYAEKQTVQLSPEFAITCFFVAVAFSQLVGGVLADRLPLHRLLLLATFGMVFSLLMLWACSGRCFFLSYAAYGLAQGLIQAVGSTVWVRYFGREHLGKLKSGAMMAMVAGSSVGPLLMSLTKDIGWNYNVSLLGFLALALLNTAAASTLRPPSPAR
jgi:MFS family permease